MMLNARGFVSCALFITAIGSGCTSMWHSRHADDCPQPRRYSDEWWQQEAQKPVGARQIEKKGKVWPPYPRPADDGGQQCCHEYYAAHYWPWPYLCDDRNYVRAASQSQINNGWMTECTLYDYYFEEESQSLTDSGRLHLRWILEHAPPQHRMVWVQQSATQDISQLRLAMVRKAAMEIAGESNLPAIALRVATPLGRPALEVDAIRRAEIGSIPEPRIPFEALPTGTGGGGS